MSLTFQQINRGLVANDGGGDTAREMARKTNENFQSIEDSFDEPGGIPTIDEDGEIKGKFVSLTNIQSEINAMILEAGRIAYATDTTWTVIGDGVTAGGKLPVARGASFSNNNVLWISPDLSIGGGGVSEMKVLNLGYDNPMVGLYSGGLRCYLDGSGVVNWRLGDGSEDIDKDFRLKSYGAVAATGYNEVPTTSSGASADISRPGFYITSHTTTAARIIFAITPGDIFKFYNSTTNTVNFTCIDSNAAPGTIKGLSSVSMGGHIGEMITIHCIADGVCVAY